MLKFFIRKPLTYAQAIAKLAETNNIKHYTTQILALDECSQKMPGNTFSVMA